MKKTNTTANKYTATALKNAVKWLKEQDCGCHHFPIAWVGKYELDICVGWHDNGEGYEIAWKIGMQTAQNGMQCDLDIDFLMPYNEETGDVYDTMTTIDDDCDFKAEVKAIRKAAEDVYEWYDKYRRENFPEEFTEEEGDTYAA